MTSQDEGQLLDQLKSACQAVRTEVAKVVVGQDEVVTDLLISVLSEGHALLVGVPGLAKTLIVSSFAKTLDLEFGRVQFTPDLLPADITGTDVLRQQEHEGRVRHEVEFLKGPIFKNVVLADEINRTPPKTQAALLQAMQERYVTSGGKHYELPRPFLVLATQNPIEQEGTYALPEAQLDRFLLEIRVDYPSASEEMEIARRTTSGPAPELRPVLARDLLSNFSALVPRIPMTEEALALAVQLARATRPEGDGADERIRKYVRFGAGPRGSRAIVLCAKAFAAISGRPAADLEDVLAVSERCLRHRLVLSYRAEADGVSAGELISGLKTRFALT